MSDTTKPEIVQLLRRINEGAMNSQVPLGDLMRSCLRLGGILGNRELISWAKSESGGYQSTKDLPDYRIMETEVHGTFSGPYGKSIPDGTIPKVFINKEHRDVLFKAYLTESVGELEQLAATSTDSNGLSIPWSGDAILYYQQKTIYQGHVLVAAWQVITTTFIVGVLEVIRARVLEFVMVIEKELGIDAMNYDDKKPLETPDQQRVQQIFNTTIHGGTSFAFGNSGTTNQYAEQVQPGDLQGLKEKLTQLGVSKDLITDLNVALDKDADSDQQPGPHVQGWFGKLMIKAGQGTLQLVSATATTIVMAEIRRFLGLPPALGHSLK